MATSLSESARAALAATDWSKIDAMTDEDLARQIASNPDAAPDLAPDIDVRAIRRGAAMTQAEFAQTYEFSVRTPVSYTHLDVYKRQDHPRSPRRRWRGQNRWTW